MSAAALCGELPYGTRRRVEVARALAANPRLLLLDEPAAGLNEIEQADLGAAGSRRSSTPGVTVLVIEHNLFFLGALAHAAGLPRPRAGHRRRLARGGARDPRVIEAYLGSGGMSGSPAIPCKVC